MSVVASFLMGASAGLVMVLALASSEEGNHASPASWTSSMDYARYAPCKDWLQKPDGSWTYRGSMRAIGVRSTSFRNSGETKVLAQRCAKKK